jgi:hypothetical protein
LPQLLEDKIYLINLRLCIFNPLANRKALFWDIHENEIENILLDNDEWVVVRVFEYGTMYDIYDVIDFYGKDKVVEILKGAELNSVVASIAFILFDLPKKKDRRTYATS